MNLAPRAAITMMILAFVPPLAASGELDAGVMALGRGQYDKALEIFTPLAEAGDFSGQSFLAHTYTLLEDYDRAYAWYFASAECGSADAEVELAILSQKLAVPQRERGEALGRAYYDRYCVEK